MKAVSNLFLELSIINEWNHGKRGTARHGHVTQEQLNHISAKQKLVFDFIRTQNKYHPLANEAPPNMYVYITHDPSWSQNNILFIFRYISLSCKLPLHFTQDFLHRIADLTWTHHLCLFETTLSLWLLHPYSAGAVGDQEGLLGWGRQGVQGSGNRTVPGWSGGPSWSSPPLAVKKRETGVNMTTTWTGDLWAVSFIVAQGSKR